MLRHALLQFFALLTLLIYLPFSLGHDGVAAVLAANRDLSTLNAIISQYPDLIANLSGTLLAPSNAALDTFIAAQGGLTALAPSAIQDLLAYHVLPGAPQTSTDLSKAGGTLAPTSLLSTQLANLDGAPNVVFASAFGSTGQETVASGLRIYSGVGLAANVTRPDLAFDTGVVHVIDRVLNIPQNCSTTAEVASLSTLVQALDLANLTDTVDTISKFTCFAPTDAAFQAAGIDVTKLTVDQLTDALKYHSIVGEVAYSTALESGKEYKTLLGAPVTVYKRDGKLFINDAEVLVGNVVMTNGVAQVLNKVLSPPANYTPPATGVSGGSSGGTSAGSTSAAMTSSPSLGQIMLALALAISAYAL